MDRQPAAGPRGGQPGARGHRREGALFSPLKGGLRKAGSVIFPRSLSRAREWQHLCGRLSSGCGSGHSLGLASAGPLAGWGGPRAGLLLRAAAALLPGVREPRPGRGARKSPRLGCQWASPSTVCAEELEQALATQQAGQGATAPCSGPKHLPFPSASHTGTCGQLPVPSPAHSPWLWGTAALIFPGPLLSI